MPLVTQIVGSFLEKNPDCESFINRLLNQLEADSGVKLGGDIKHFLKEFEQNGVLILTPVTSTNPDSHVSAGGQSSPFRTDGMNIQVFMTRKWYGRHQASNISAFLHELVHAIGNLVGSGTVNEVTGDKQVARAVFNMGLMKISPEEYYKQYPASQGENSNIPASNYWRGTLDLACGRDLIPNPLIKSIIR
jgi:hypothetical protein